MEYTGWGSRIYRHLLDIDGFPIRIQQSDRKAQDAVWVLGDDEGAAIQVDRTGAIEIIDGLTAFLAHTDGIEDLPEV
jgi:hypothetical protein